MARQCSPLKRKFMECCINNPALSLLMKHLVIGQRQKAPNFSAFHWSPHGSLVSIGQHFVTIRVVHLPKRTETSLITKSDQSGPNHQLLQLCTACTAWSESDQAVRAVHSCSSWLNTHLPFVTMYFNNERSLYMIASYPKIALYQVALYSDYLIKEDRVNEKFNAHLSYRIYPAIRWGFCPSRMTSNN